MLFTSWRNEETDLIGNSPSYQERVLFLKDKIDKWVYGQLADGPTRRHQLADV